MGLFFSINLRDNHRINLTILYVRKSSLLLTSCWIAKLLKGCLSLIYITIIRDWALPKQQKSSPMYNLKRLESSRKVRRSSWNLMTTLSPVSSPTPTSRLKYVHKWIMLEHVFILNKGVIVGECSQLFFSDISIQIWLIPI